MRQKTGAFAGFSHPDIQIKEVMPCPDPEFGSPLGLEERRFCVWLKAIEEAAEDSTVLRSKHS
jgi:hypothetical protein